MKLYCFGVLLLFGAPPAFGALPVETPQNVEIIYLQQVDAAIREGRLTQAAQMISTLEQSDAREFRDDLALLRAEYAIARMDVTSAAVALSAITDVHRNTCRVHAAKGWVAANQNDFQPAVTALSVATASCPDDAGAWNLLGLAHIGAGQALPAQKALEHALALAPDNPQVMNNHALAALQRGEVDLALRELNRAAVQRPHDDMILANRNFVAGMVGLSPERAKDESDADWSAKLVQYAKGAKSASRGPQATALFARAMLTLERFDQNVWSELNPALERPR